MKKMQLPDEFVPVPAGRRVFMKRVLLTGAGGFVGARVMQQLAGRLDLVPAPRGLMARGREEDIARLVQETRPDVILHTAALSDTGYCEAHLEESRRANIEVPLWLAKAAAGEGARLVAFSSDQVYAGVTLHGPLPEDLPLAPANVYGRHKLEMEQRVLEILPQAVLLRATWLYDLPGYGLPVRGNLPLNLLRAAAHRESVTFSPGDYRGVTYVRQAVENLLPVLELPGGVYNFGSENDLDMLETAWRFCAALRIHPDLVPGDRTRNLSMNTAKAQGGGVVFDTTVEGIFRCLRDYGLSELL